MCCLSHFGHGCSHEILIDDTTLALLIDRICYGDAMYIHGEWMGSGRYRDNKERILNILLS